MPPRCASKSPLPPAAGTSRGTARQDGVVADAARTVDLHRTSPRPRYARRVDSLSAVKTRRGAFRGSHCWASTAWATTRPPVSWPAWIEVALPAHFQAARAASAA
jgi:hypothetical protein